jgi:RimJ/RimL family protein N-acetyltransferase
MNTLRIFLLILFFIFKNASCSFVEITDNEVGFSVQYPSKNLFLRSPQEDDKQYYFDLFRNPIAMEKYMQGIPRPMEEIEKRFSDYLNNTRKHTPWNSYLVFYNEFEELAPMHNKLKFAGHVMLEPSDRGMPNEVELSYILLPGHWNRGIATNAVSLLLDAAKKDFCYKYPLNFQKITHVYATARPDNPGSCRVLEKNQFRLSQTVNKFGCIRYIYELKFAEISLSAA